MSVRTGEGTTLSYSPDDGTTWTVLAQVLSIQPPGFSRPSVSTKHLRSDYATKRPGKIPDFGQVQARIQYDPSDATHRTLYGMAKDLTAYQWKVEYYDESGVQDGSDTFPGFVSELGPDQAEDEGNHETDVTIEVSGNVVRA